MARRYTLASAVLSSVVTAGVPDFGADFTPAQEPNMNGAYVFSTTPGGVSGKFPPQYKDYPGGVEFYDVLSPPMSTYYSQVWWSPLAPVALPDELVKKYANKSVAIVGWEIDQVRITDDGKELSVPISATYNHHYNAQIIGAAARFRKVSLSGPEDPLAKELLKTSSHGMLAYDQPHYIVEQVADSAGPSSTFVTSGNGGEYRKTYHGYAPGYAVVIESPTELQISPMQIDTWNRDEMDISGPVPPKFVAGPLPRASESPPNATYSGLLECPMTTRLTKAIDGEYLVERNVASCDAPILTFQECFHAANETLSTGGQHFVTHTVSDSALPAGCTVTSSVADPLTVHVTFNTIRNASVSCAQTKGTTLLTGATRSLVDVGVSLDTSKDLATITLSGPSDVWFAVGFGAQAMADEPWTVVVDGSGVVSERKLGGAAPNSHVAGKELTPSVEVVNISTTNNTRVVVLTRALTGATLDYYTFNVSDPDTTIPFINAIGTGPQLAYHKDKAPAALSLLPTETGDGSVVVGACVCPQDPPAFGQATGQLVYRAVANQTVDVGTGSVGFRKQKCAKYPATVLNEQRNPTCDIRYYQGGQWACHHMWSLLDADQEIPWTDQPLVFHHKWRLWVQPYNESYHQPVHYGFDTTMVIGSPYEYDVPHCADGVPGCSLVDGTWIHTITGNRMGNHNFAALNFHCHAPTCLSMAVYACAASVALEDCNATVGKLLCEQRPVYGGSGAPELNGTRFDETGYIAIPDCFWGSAEQGLEAPVNVTGLPLHMIKTANATYAHYGEMAGGQPFVF